MSESEPTTAELVEYEPGAIVAPAARLSTIVVAFHAYQEIQARLLVASDYQEIQGKRFPKKSAWRKLALAFNVTTHIDDERIEYDDAGILRATYRVSAVAPNGRAEQGVGVCSRYDKCGPRCSKPCDGVRHFSHPEHDIVATAHTRAKNRACSDLFGFGEISAEEVGTVEECGGFDSKAEWRDTVAELREAVTAAGLVEWVREQEYAWPWDALTCKVIAARIDAASSAPVDSTEGRSPASSAAETASAPVRAEMVATSEARTGDQPHASCAGPGCGHDKSIHTPACTGVHVRGIPNSSEGWNEPCSCQSFVPRESTLEQQLQASLDALAPPISVAEYRKTRDDEPSSVEQRQQVALACKEAGWSDDQRHAFVWQITKGRADGASSCTQGDARLVLKALALLRAKSLKVEWFDGDDQDAHGGWVVEVMPLNKPGRDWYDNRP